jgi:hypothetical protein
MNPEIIRRRQLGLTITGPFNRNRPRRLARRITRTALVNLVPAAITAGVVIGIIAFTALIFL